MKRVLTYNTEKLLGEVLVTLRTGWVVSQDKVLGLLESIKSDLKLGVREESLSRIHGAIEVTTVNPNHKGLSDGEVLKYQRYIEECAKSSRMFENQCGEVIDELLEMYRSVTEG